MSQKPCGVRPTLVNSSSVNELTILLIGDTVRDKSHVSYMIDRNTKMEGSSAKTNLIIYFQIFDINFTLNV